MRILIAPLGSHGDTLPFVGLGLALQARGHEVRVYGNGLFAPLFGHVGLDFVETSPARLAQEALADTRATHPRRGIAMVAEGALSTVEPTLQAMARDVQPGRTWLLGSTLAFAPRLLAEAKRLPFVAIHLSPSMYRSVHLGSRFTQRGDFGRWPPTLKRGFWRLVDRAILDPLFARPLNRMRSALGLPPVRRLMQDWIHAGRLNLGLFPAWLAPPQPDWPANLQLTGFPLYDADPQATPSPELERFLADGAAPVIFTAGTANTRSEAFYAQSALSCARLGLRGVLVAARREQVPAELPAGVIHVPYAPFSQLFGRASVAVHHGGIGTLSQALRAGVPQLIRPMAYDQFDNASRAARLGVARELSVAAYGRPARLDAALSALAGDAAIRQSCLAVALRMRGECGLEAACDALEQAFREGPGAGADQALA